MLAICRVLLCVHGLGNRYTNLEKADHTRIRFQKDLIWFALTHINTRIVLMDGKCQSTNTASIGVRQVMQRLRARTMMQRGELKYDVENTHQIATNRAVAERVEAKVGNAKR